MTNQRGIFTGDPLTNSNMEPPNNKINVALTEDNYLEDLARQIAALSPEQAKKLNSYIKGKQ